MSSVRALYLGLATVLAMPTQARAQSGVNQLAEMMFRMEQLDIQRASLDAQRSQADAARMQGMERMAAQRRLFDQRWIAQIQSLAQPRAVYGTIAQRLLPRLVATGNDLFLVDPAATDDRMRSAAEPHFLWLDDEKKRFISRVVLPLKPVIDSIGLTPDMNQSFFGSLSAMVDQGFMNMPDRRPVDFRVGIAGFLVSTRARVDSAARARSVQRARADSVAQQAPPSRGAAPAPRRSAPVRTRRPAPD